MFDEDVVIIGGGPAGLSAGTILADAGLKTLVLEKEDLGGYLKKVERFNGHPDYPEGVAGPELAERLIARAEQSGLRMEFGEVVEIESYTSCRSVTCADGKNYTTTAVILAGGRQARKINIPGEVDFLNKGVIHCVLCDAGLYNGKTVAVCGGGNTGVSDALHLARYADRVIVIEQQSALTAMDKLTALAAANGKLEFLYGTTVSKITGSQVVESIQVRKLSTGETSNIGVDGVVIDVGYSPDTRYLDGILPLDAMGRIIVNEEYLDTEIEGVFAIGDIRSETSLNLMGAIRDAEKTAAAILDIFMKELKR